MSEKRKNLIIDTEIPATLTLLYDDETQEEVKTRIVTMSGGYCKVLLPTSTSAKNGIIEFKLGVDAYKIFCKLTKWNKELTLLRLDFAYPFDIPEGVQNPYAWLEAMIRKWAQKKELTHKAA